MSISVLEPLMKSRAGLKGWVTKAINELKELRENGTLTIEIFKQKEDTVDRFLLKIQDLNHQIYDVYAQNNLADDDVCIAHMDASIIFNNKQRDILSDFDPSVKVCDSFGKSKQNNDELHHGLSREEFIEALSKLNCNPRSELLDCQTFCGDHTDKHLFSQWLPQLLTVVNMNPSWDDSCKLTFLHNKVAGCAKEIIRPVGLDTGTFQQAVDTLNNQYLNKELNKDQLFHSLLIKEPKYSSDYEVVSVYIDEVRATLISLKNYYEVDLLDARSAGYQFISHLIFSKLPTKFQDALISRIKINYPSLNDIIDNHVKIIHMLKYK